MNLFQHLARTIIHLAFRIGIPAVEALHDRQRLRQQGAALADYPEGSLGREIGDCLRRHGLHPLPFYESHDLKHVLLGYDMTPVDEIRLQAFMVGNGNHSLASLALFAIGAVLLPEEWPAFRRAFRRGKATVPISCWTVSTHGYCNADALRRTLFNGEQRIARGLRHSFIARYQSISVHGPEAFRDARLHA
jgi:hypothetical protein